MNSNFKTQLSSGCGRQKNITGSEENSVNDKEILSTMGFFSFEGTWGKKNTWQRLFNNKKVVEFMFHVQAFAGKWGHCSKCNHSVRFYFYFNFSSKLLELPYFPTTVSVNLFFFLQKSHSSWEVNHEVFSKLEYFQPTRQNL